MGDNNWKDDDKCFSSQNCDFDAKANMHCAHLIIDENYIIQYNMESKCLQGNSCLFIGYYRADSINEDKVKLLAIVSMNQLAMCRSSIEIFSK